MYPFSYKYIYVIEYERKREEDEEESDYCEGEGPQEAFERVAPQNWVGSPTMASAFADAILQNDALRVLYLSEGGFATLARGIKHR